MVDDNVSTLYKYRPIDKFTLSILATGQIFYPKPTQFNDPFDTKCSFKKISQSVSEDVLKSIGETSESIVAYQRDKRFGVELRNQLDNMGILCLSETPTNFLLWSHYAESHTGICIGLERNEDNELGDRNKTLKVSYTTNYPSVSELSLKKYRIDETKKRILYTKSELWSYEQEWRVIIEQGDRLMDLPGRISEVILGCKVKPDDVALVKKLVTGRGIAVRQVRMKENQFGLKLVTI